MKFSMLAAAATTAAALIATPVLAAPYADVGEFATFTTGGNFTSSVVPTVLGATATLTTTNAIASGTEELESTNGQSPSLLSGPLTLMVGGANAGLTFTTDYDRSAVVDVADGNVAGAETGTFTFTLGNTTFANIVNAGTLQIITASGLLSADDGGFYGPANGSWVFSATISSSSANGTYSFTVSVPPQPITGVSEPAVLAIAGAGLIGLAVARRRA